MKRLWHIGLALMVLAGLMIPSPAFAVTSTYYSSASDGWLLSYGSYTYSNIWDYAVAQGVGSSSSEAWLGQRVVDGYYNVYRTMLYFDTSAIPDNAVITGVTLELYGVTDYSTTDFDIQVQSGQPTYPHDPLVQGDYYRGFYSGNGGSINTSAFVTSAYNEITLNATGISWVSQTGVTKLAIRSSRDINGTTPSGSEYVVVSMSETLGVTQDPKLNVTYTIGATVSTTPATSVASTTATLNGNITSLGSETITDRGFEWGTSPGTYTANWTESAASYGTGTYSYGASGLTDATTYYFRSLIIGSTIYYGNELSFTTTSISLSVQTNNAGNIAPTSALFQGMLTSIGGASWVSVYFEYGTTSLYGSQTEETSIESTGTFNQTVTGLRYNTTYHYRAVARYGSSLFYGADVFFTTLSATGSSTDLIIVSAKAFQNFRATGDMLFVAEIINTYTGFYPNDSPAKYFTFQLLSTDGSTVLAATPLQFWGDRPIGIYINPTQALLLIEGEPYYLRVIGTGISSQPYAMVQLQDKDWKGIDMTELDRWLLATTTNMQLSDEKTYLTSATDVGVVITDVAGAYFTQGIPAISRERPNMFESHREINSFTDDTVITPATQGWDHFVGPIIAADSAVFAAPFGVTGKNFMAGAICLIVLGFIMVVTASTGGFGALGALFLCIPLLWLGQYFEILPTAILTMIVLGAAAMWIRQFVVKTL